MGKYSKINATSLANAISKALNEIDRYNLNYIHNNLNRSDTIDSSANLQIDAAFNKIINNKSYNGSIAKLKADLSNLKKAVENISKCQDLEKEIRNLEKKLYDSDGKKNSSVAYQIRYKEQSLSNYENKVDNLLSKN